MVWMIVKMIYCDDEDLKQLKHGCIYIVDDEWGRLMCKAQVCAEYVIVK